MPFLRALFAVAVAVSACETPIPDWDPHAARADAASALDASDVPHLEFDPPASRDDVTRVVRIFVKLGAPAGAPRVLLLEGALTAAQLRDLARPAVPQTLAGRTVPALIWSSSDGAIAVAPLAPLTAGALYTVGVSEPSLALPFTVTPVDRAPVLARLWPDPASDAPARGAVWCGRDALPEVDVAVTLVPAGAAGRLARGTGASVPAEKCVGWLPGVDLDADRSGVPAMTPPSIALGGGAIALLEPALLWPGSMIADPVDLACETTEVQFGPGCATVEDDRIVVRPPEGSVLWTIDDGTGSTVERSRSGRWFVKRPLPADARYLLAALDESGRVFEGEVNASPGPPRSHVIINEVMANPAGVERSQEWVELYNDGTTPIDVSDYVLESSGRNTVLPAGVLASGAFALVVTDAYVDDDGVDPVTAPGTLLLRVAALGRDGLSNDGERLVLRDAAGTALSSFPAMKAKNGVSNVRTAPEAPDANADSFAASPNGSATPGAANGAP